MLYCYNAISIEGLPSEFPIFVAGENTATHGQVLFDDAAAQAVMAAYTAHGVDIMLDLEHLSIDQRNPHYNPDALAWAQLEMRNGELWAVNVKWTDEGARRLNTKSQRYISPCFATDANGRVTRLVNIGLTALPATHQTPHLIAASETSAMAEADAAMTLDKIPALAELLGLSPDASFGDFMTAVKGLAEAVKPAGEEEPAAEEPVDPMAATEPEPSEASLMLNSVTALTGKDAFASIEDIKTWRAAWVAQEEQKAQNEKDRVVLENAERRTLIVSLVKVGAELPATAWSDPLAKVLTPCDRLANEPLESLRSRVKAWSEAGAAKQIKPPANVSANGLSERELKMCAEKNIDPNHYAAIKATRGN